MSQHILKVEVTQKFYVWVSRVMLFLKHVLSSVVSQILIGINLFIQKSLHWFPIQICIDFKVLLLTSKAFNGHRLACAVGLLTLYVPCCPLMSCSEQTISFLQKHELKSLEVEALWKIGFLTSG